MPLLRLLLIVVTLCYCPKTIQNKLQRVLNAAAQVVSGKTRKFDRSLTRVLYSELHWLDISQRIQYKLKVTVHQCLQGL